MSGQLEASPRGISIASCHRVLLEVTDSQLAVFNQIGGYLALTEIDLEIDLDRKLPDRVAAYLDEANRRIDHLFATEKNKRTPKFIPSDSELFYWALEYLTSKDLTMGHVFCEWGSGYGLATSLAALLGYEAYGIEIEPSLIEAAGNLARDLDVDSRFLCSSYMPEGVESYAGVGGEEIIRDHLGGEVEALSYPGMDCEITEIDVFYVFPWPGEQEFMEDFFDKIAVEGAILMIYYGEEIRAYRKTFEEDDSEDY